MKAFPITVRKGNETDFNEGMDLRDWFAGKALNAYISNEALLSACRKLASKESMTSVRYIAEVAYEHADAMLKAREVSNEG